MVEFIFGKINKIGNKFFHSYHWKDESFDEVGDVGSWRNRFLFPLHHSFFGTSAMTMFGLGIIVWSDAMQIFRLGAISTL